MAPKRKRTVLSLEKKLEIIQKLENGESGAKLAFQYSVGTSTISDIKASKNKLQQFVGGLHDSRPGTSGTSKDSTKKLKIMRAANDNVLDKAVYLWFCQERNRACPISGPLICAKATALNKELHGEETTFQASLGWLQRFRERHGIRHLSIKGESFSANKNAIEPFLEKFHTIIARDNLKSDEIYNADETGLFFRLLPDKSLVRCDERAAPGRKTSKERITLLACCNSDGSHKLPLTMVGKSARPRCFKNVKKEDLPVIYENQSNSWMDRNLFKRWFLNSFVPEVKKNQRDRNYVRALLVLDNAPSHIAEDLKIADDDTCTITVLFLPPNTTSIIQPLDQGVISCLKRNYKKNLLTEVVSVNPNKGIDTILKQIHLLDVAYMIAQVWKEISIDTITGCFKKIMPIQTEETINANDGEGGETEDELNEFRQLFEEITEIFQGEQTTDNEINEWLHEEEQDPAFDLLTDAQLLDKASHSVEINSDSEEEEDICPISNQEAAEMANKLAIWLDYQADMDPITATVLRQIKSNASKKHVETVVQKKMTYYFNKE